MVYSHVLLTAQPPTRTSSVCPIFWRVTIFGMLTIRRYAILFVVTVIVVGASAPLIAQGQGFPEPLVPEECRGADAATQCTLCSLTQLARNVLNFAIFIAIVMSAVLFAWAGIRYLTNMGNLNVAATARKTLVNVFLGLLLILCAWLVINTLMGIMVNSTFKGLLPWNQLCNSIRTGDGYTYISLIPKA